MVSRFIRQCVSFVCAAGLLVPLSAIGQSTTESSSAPPEMSAPRASAAMVDVSTVSSIAKPVIAGRAWITVDAVTGKPSLHTIQANKWNPRH